LAKKEFNDSGPAHCAGRKKNNKKKKKKKNKQARNWRQFNLKNSRPSPEGSSTGPVIAGLSPARGGEHVLPHPRFLRPERPGPETGPVGGRQTGRPAKNTGVVFLGPAEIENHNFSPCQTFLGWVSPEIRITGRRCGGELWRGGEAERSFFWPLLKNE